MRDVGNVLALLDFSHLILPVFVFVQVVAWDCITGSDSSATDTGTKVTVTVCMLLFWGLIIFLVVRQVLRTTRKSLQGPPTFTVTYLPEKGVEHQ
jgi:hypothetical protein